LAPVQDAGLKTGAIIVLGASFDSDVVEAEFPHDTIFELTDTGSVRDSVPLSGARIDTFPAVGLTSDSLEAGLALAILTLVLAASLPVERPTSAGAARASILAAGALAAVALANDVFVGAMRELAFNFARRVTGMIGYLGRDGESTHVVSSIERTLATTLLGNLPVWDRS